MKETTIEFTHHADQALVSMEKEGAVCSYCGVKLFNDYYILLSAYRSHTKELVSPRRRFCPPCFVKIELLVYHHYTLTSVPLEISPPLLPRKPP